MKRLEIPENLHRNHPNVASAGYEHTGETLIRLAMHRMRMPSLQDVDILDVGCGVRFTMAIINRNIPVKSYTGIEVYKPIVDFLNENVAVHDRRFKFVHWNVYNELYNPQGVELSNFEALPLSESFDAIWLFSVFTHLNPNDTKTMLAILRKHIRANGKLFFSAFIDEDLDDFEDRIKDKPLLNAYYGRKFMESLIEQGKWRIEGFYDKDLGNYIQHHFVCSPC